MDTPATLGVARLKDYHVSDTVGFLLENPKEHLPDYFWEWERLGKSVPELLHHRTLRQEVDKMRLLDHTRLCDHREKRLAHMLLTFIGNAYVWQEGDAGVPQALPRSLAIPWNALSEGLGTKPIMTQAAICLSNWRQIAPTGNMDVICRLPGGESFRWFVTLIVQIEIEAVPGIKAVLSGQNAVLENDAHGVVRALNSIATTVATMTSTLDLYNDKIDPFVFFNTLRPFLAGWGGEGTPMPDGLLYQGVSETRVKLRGGSAAQSSVITTLDSALGIVHNEGKQKFLDDMMEYMPRDHRNFIIAVRKGPSIRDFVHRCGDEHESLRDAYDSCVQALAEFRSVHIKIVAKFIVAPSTQESLRNRYKNVSRTGTGGTELLPFLRDIRNTTCSAATTSTGIKPMTQ